jgi:hypothetical protein
MGGLLAMHSAAAGFTLLARDWRAPSQFDG